MTNPPLRIHHWILVVAVLQLIATIAIGLLSASVSAHSEASPAAHIASPAAAGFREAERR